MGKSCLYNLFCVLLLLSVLGCSEATTNAATSLYVFGDSFFDPGNSCLLNNPSCKFKPPKTAPYGVDLPQGCHLYPRSSNGRTTIDFIDEFLGQPYQPPILEMEGKSLPRGFTYDGFNYATSGAGITGTIKAVQKVLDFKTQVELFRNTTREVLPLRYKSKSKIAKHLSQSIFIVQIGFNDYGCSFMPQICRESQNYSSLSPKEFADFLVKELEKGLEDLYRFGARKLIVFELPPYDCFPIGMMRTGGKERCERLEIDAVPCFYNSKLAIMIEHYKLKFPDSTVVMAKTFDFYMDLIKNPSHYGIRDATNPCCEVDRKLAIGGCKPNAAVCKDRDSHAFFDAVHPSEATHKVIAQKCFNGSGLCVPLNIRQLVDKKD